MSVNRIVALKELLENSNIPHEYHDDFGGYIYYPARNNDEFYCVVTNECGEDEDEEYYLDVGFSKGGDSRKCSVSDVYEVIVEHYETNRHFIKSDYSESIDTGVVIGKGRLDLIPLDVIYNYQQMFHDFNEEQRNFIREINDYQNSGNEEFLYYALNLFIELAYMGDFNNAMLEVAKQFEQESIEHGEQNWQKGIPVKSYIDNTLRSYFKWLNGCKDKQHDIIIMWNLMCCIWTVENRLEV